MKTVFCGMCIVLLGLTFYFPFAQKGTTVPETSATLPQSVQNQEKIVAASQKAASKKCACCNQKLSPAQGKAKQRQEQREAWARQMIIDHGYEEGMKRITAKSPWLAKQIQRILDREKRIGQASTASQSDTR